MKCGEPGAAGASSPVQQAPAGSLSRTAKATLSLAEKGGDQATDTDASFKRKTGTRRMTLVYRVTGCEMTGSEPRPLEPLRVYDTNGAGDPLPDGVIRLDGDPSVENSTYLVHLKVSSDDFDPGSYSGLVEIKANWLNTVRTPVTISRSENKVVVPFGWGALGAIVGIAFFVMPHWLRKSGLLVTRRKLLVVVVLGVLTGGVSAVVGNYLNQDVWTSSANWWGTAVIGFTGATAGVMAALWASVWPDPQKSDGDGGGPKPTPEPTPTPGDT